MKAVHNMIAHDLKAFGSLCMLHDDDVSVLTCFHGTDVSAQTCAP